MDFSIINQITQITPGSLATYRGYGYILEMLDSGGNTKLAFMTTTGILNRIYLKDYEIKVLPIAEQIQIYNKEYFKFMNIPEHLKSYK